MAEGNVCIATVQGAQFFWIPQETIAPLVAKLLQAPCTEDVETCIEKEIVQSGKACIALSVFAPHTVTLIRRRKVDCYVYLLRYCNRNNDCIFAEQLPVPHQWDRQTVYDLMTKKAETIATLKMELDRLAEALRHVKEKSFTVAETLATVAVATRHAQDANNNIIALVHRTDI